MTPAIHFRKAHACGNDFLIVNKAELAERDPGALARALCARTVGVGADGVEFLSETPGQSAAIELFNADGSRAEISGNGTRCVAAWMAHERGLGAGDAVVLVTDAGERRCVIEAAIPGGFVITTGMGVPSVEARVLRLAEGAEVRGAVVLTGNPHFVIFTSEPEFACAGRPWQEMGAAICGDTQFAGGTNVEFVRLHRDGAAAELRIFERGVGPTASSGTGTSAAAAASIALRGAAAELRVEAPGGPQTVRWSGDGAELLLTGPAQLVASGVFFTAGRVA